MERQEEVITFIEGVAGLRRRRSMGWLLLAFLLGVLSAGALFHGGAPLEMMVTFLFTGGPFLVVAAMQNGTFVRGRHPRLQVQIGRASYRSGAWTVRIEAPSGEITLRDHEVSEALCFYDDHDDLLEPMSYDQLHLMIRSGHQTMSFALPVTDEVQTTLVPLLGDRLRYVRIA